MFGASNFKGLSAFGDFGLIGEYDGHTSSYAQRTRHAACTLNVQISTPHILTELGFASFGPRFGSLS